MTEQELREKIVRTITNLNNICRKGCVCKNCKYENYDNCTESVLDENAIFDDDVCRYILSNTKLTEEYYIEQAEKELQEEWGDE